jgi:hypothetical protein
MCELNNIKFRYVKNMFLNVAALPVSGILMYPKTKSTLFQIGLGFQL